MFLFFMKEIVPEHSIHNVSSRDQNVFTLIKSARSKFKNSQSFSPKREYKIIICQSYEFIQEHRHEPKKCYAKFVLPFVKINKQTFPFICRVMRDNERSKDKLEPFKFCVIFSCWSDYPVNKKHAELFIQTLILKSCS